MGQEKLDPTKIRMESIHSRQHKMTLERVKSIWEVSSLYQHPDLSQLAAKIAIARRSFRPVIWLMGAHVLRQGNSRLIIDLMERGIITHVATNGAVPIHDFELAYIGATLEDVEYYIKDGRFGNWEETGRHINGAVVRGYHDGIGFGQAIGRMIEEEECGDVPHKEISIFAAAYRLGVPITVHKGVGYDITDQYPQADFAAIGKTSGDDFLTLARSLEGLTGGVFLNLGSQVMGPEVYLKGLSMARNIAKQQQREIRNFTTAVFDLIDLGDWRAEEHIVDFRSSGAMSDPRYYFRPLKSILIRTVKDGGQSFYIRGDFKTTVPALYRGVISEMG